MASKHFPGDSTEHFRSTNSECCVDQLLLYRQVPAYLGKGVLEGTYNLIWRGIYCRCSLVPGLPSRSLHNQACREACSATAKITKQHLPSQISIRLTLLLPAWLNQNLTLSSSIGEPASRSGQEWTLAASRSMNEPGWHVPLTLNCLIGSHCKAQEVNRSSRRTPIGFSWKRGAGRAQHSIDKAKQSSAKAANKKITGRRMDGISATILHATSRRSLADGASVISNHAEAT